MAVELADVEIWVVLDAEGDYGVGRDEQAAMQNYDDEIGGDLTTLAYRKARVVLKMPQPQTLGVVVTIPTEPEPTIQVS